MRARNIKPGFFENEYLAECDPLARILFAGLWCMADREGRLEDRPKKIKAKILPYDDCDIPALLNQLAQFGFITRYVCDDCHYIQINNFTKHQNPHCKETESTIPAPCKHSTSTVLEQDEHSSSPADSLIPDSGFSDSLIPDSESSEEDSLSADESADVPIVKKPPPCPHKEIIAAYHELLPELPQVNVWNQSSKKNLQARWREDKARQSLDWWKWLFAERIGNSDFLMGKIKEFRADLDWIVRPNNFQKIMNGRYQNRDSAQQKIQPRNYKEAQDAERRQRALRLISQKQGRDGNAEDGNNQDGIGQAGNCLPSSGIQ